ncbi:MAG: hypothetical protein AABX99_03245 [Nanoarchaeota archaeon]
MGIEEGKICSKLEYYVLYERGFFGNKALTWDSTEEIENSGWKGKICIRGRKGIARSKARFNFTLKETTDYVEQLRKEGIPKKALVFNQSMPDEHLTIQGEIMRKTPEIYALTYTTIKKPMNRAFEEETLYANGLTALNLMKGNLFPSSYEDLQELFDLFPDSIIEFSAYDIEVGNLQGRNTIMWEVRNY